MKADKNSQFLVRTAKGFTLLEMVIVLGIIAVILGTAIGLSGGFLGFGKEVATESKIQKVSAALMTYNLRAGFYPTEAQGLKALVERPTSAPEPKKWERTFDTVPKDGWKQELVYKYPGSKDPTRPEVISKGSDGELNTDDDISSQDQKD